METFILKTEALKLERTVKVTMGLFVFLLIVVVVAVLSAKFFTASNNYLDTNINPRLDVLGHLGYKKEMDDEERRYLNNLLIPNLSLQTKLSIINAEKNLFANRKFDQLQQAQQSQPSQQFLNTPKV